MTDQRAFGIAEAVWRELDQIRIAMTKQAESFERAVVRLEERDEARDREVSELKLQVSKLSHHRSSAPPPRDWKRDAGLVIAPSTIVAIISAVAQQFAQPAQQTPEPRAPAAQVQPWAPVSTPVQP